MTSFSNFQLYGAVTVKLEIKKSFYSILKNLNLFILIFSTTFVNYAEKNKNLVEVFCSHPKHATVINRSDPTLI
jgi:hypothetical protein